VATVDPIGVEIAEIAAGAALDDAEMAAADFPIQSMRPPARSSAHPVRNRRFVHRPRWGRKQKK
jgi:hypothetical protein